MKVLLRSRIYALWNEKSADGSSTYGHRVAGNSFLGAARTPSAVISQ